MTRVATRPCDLAALDAITAEAVALFCFEDSRPLAGVAGLVDWRVHGAISRAITGGVFAGRSGEVLLLPVTGRFGPKRLFVFGLGEMASCTEEVLNRSCQQAAEVLRQANATATAWATPAGAADPDLAAGFRSSVEAAVTAGQGEVLTELNEEVDERHRKS